MKLKSLLALLLLGAGITWAKSPVETYGPLSISGNKLVDSSGKAVTLRGMSLFWHMHDGGKEFWKKSVVQNAMVDWHASVIRAAMGVDNETSNGFTQYGYISEPATAVAAVKTVVDAAVEAGMYVIVDYHAHNAGSNVNAASTFFKEMSELYGNTPNVIWEIWNEPITGSWSEIANYAKTIIPIIRKNSRNVILVGTGFYCQNLTDVDNTLDAYPNLAYVLHFYAGSHTWTDRLGTTMNKGKAVFVSEWGTTDASGNGGYNASMSQTWLNEMDRLGISNCNWSLGNPLKNGVVETSAALEATANVSGPWTLAEITTSGEFVRNYLINKNPAWTLSDTTTRLTSPLKATPDSVALVVTDTVLLSSGYNKVVKNWVLTLKGRTSGATYNVNQANTSQVSVKWRAGQRDPGGIAFAAGEYVDVTLTPGNGKTSFRIKAATSVNGRALRSAPISWTRNELALATSVAGQGSIATIKVLDAQGRTEWQTKAPVGANGSIRATPPSATGLKLVRIEVEGDTYQALVTPGL